MLKNADYILHNVLRSDERNTTLNYCKKAQVGVDLSVKEVLKIKKDCYGSILKDKTLAPEYEKIPADMNKGIQGWHLKKGTYILTLNEGCDFGPNDTGLIIGRSSLNRSGCTIVSCVWDPGYSSVTKKELEIDVAPMSVRLNVDAEEVIIEQNARVAQLIVLKNVNTVTYDGQWQGGRMTSKLVNEVTQC